VGERLLGEGEPALVRESAARRSQLPGNPIVVVGIADHAHAGVVEPPMRLREALAQSRNMVAARLLESTGTEPVIDHARRLGIQSQLPRDLSLALGSGSVTPMELTNAYATFAAQGNYQDWELLLEVRDGGGHGVMLPPRASPRSVLSPAEAYVMTSALESVVQRGTGRGARELRLPAAGKTGTTDRARDAWFIGYTQELVAGVWVGFDDRTPLGSGEEGARAAVPIWTSFMQAWARQRRTRATEFPRPDGVSVARIDPSTGLLARPEAQDAVDEYFLAGTEPHEVAPTDAGAAGDATPSSADAAPEEAPSEPLASEGPLVLPVLAADGG
jgi:penicillin-binding protein 1A